MSPLERACREICRTNAIPESRWETFKNTLAAARRANGIAFIDLVAETANLIELTGEVLANFLRKWAARHYDEQDEIGMEKLN